MEATAELTAEVLTADFTNTVLFCEAVRKRLLERGGGTLCVFSSVAGDRGRKPVVLYGAAKAGLSRYLEGLDHKFHARGLKTVCVKPGFIKTGMTAGLRPPPFAGEPDQVARQVLRAMDRGCPKVYTPADLALGHACDSQPAPLRDAADRVLRFQATSCRLGRVKRVPPIGTRGTVGLVSLGPPYVGRLRKPRTAI